MKENIMITLLVIILGILVYTIIPKKETPLIGIAGFPTSQLNSQTLRPQFISYIGEVDGITYYAFKASSQVEVNQAKSEYLDHSLRRQKMKQTIDETTKKLGL